MKQPITTSNHCRPARAYASAPSVASPLTVLLLPLALATACVDTNTFPALNALAPPGAGPTAPAADPNQQRLEAWTGHSFAHVVTAWGEPIDTRTFDDGRMLIRFQLHDVTEGDDKGATFFENLTGKDDWAELFDNTAQTFEKTCTIGFLLSPAQKVETASIQEDDAFFGSNCSTYIKDPVQGM